MTSQDATPAALAYQYARAAAPGAPQPAVPPDDDLAPVYRSLIVAGLLGCVYSRRDDAAAACEAVEQVLRDSLQFRICRALALAMGGDAAYAAETISRHLEQQPDDDAAKVLLGVSMMLGGDSGWKPIFQNVLASSTDQSARQAAMQVVGYLRSMA